MILPCLQSQLSLSKADPKLSYNWACEIFMGSSISKCDEAEFSTDSKAAAMAMKIGLAYIRLQHDHSYSAHLSSATRQDFLSS